MNISKLDKFTRAYMRIISESFYGGLYKFVFNVNGAKLDAELSVSSEDDEPIDALSKYEVVLRQYLDLKITYHSEHSCVATVSGIPVKVTALFSQRSGDFDGYKSDYKWVGDCVVRRDDWEDLDYDVEFTAEDESTDPEEKFISLGVFEKNEDGSFKFTDEAVDSLSKIEIPGDFFDRFSTR